MDEILHDLIIGASLASVGGFLFIVIKWHLKPDNFDLRKFLTMPDRKGIERPSRAALGEMVALFATTSAYLSCMTLKPEAFAESTLVYGSIWTLRGGLSAYLRSKQK